MPSALGAWTRGARARVLHPSLPRLCVAALLSAGAPMLIDGCASRRATPPPIPPPISVAPGTRPESTATGPNAGYQGLRDDLASVDWRGLAGKRIAIDPGHGGAFAGSLGVDSLTEKAVNLGVALVLRDLLLAAGATVFMTRDSDRDFTTPSDPSLRSDLAERMRLANAFAPDLFLSIHHNADASARHDVNETQTYYQMGDDGPSLDAAEEVQRSLAANLGIVPNKVVPGNYFVVRSSEAPALLTESSYLTYPPTEARLRTLEARTLEAQAIYIGLARYFARPRPEIPWFVAVANDSAAAALPRRSAASDSSKGAAPFMAAGDSVFDGAGPLLAARVVGAADAVELRLDGERRIPERAGEQVRWSPIGPLPQGDHVATLAARMSGIGATRTRTLRFRIERPVATFRLSSRPATAPREGGLVGVRIELLDRFGLPALDSALVRLSAVCPRDSVLTSAVRAHDGVAWGYARLAPSARRTGTCVRPAFRVSLVPTAAPGHVALAAVRNAIWPGTATLTLPVAAHDGEAGTSAFLRAMPGDTALREADGTREPAPSIAWLDRNGFACVRLDSLGHAQVPALAGFRPWALDSAALGSLPARWTAWFGGALRGRRIMLDPEAGGEDSGGQGPGGTRAAEVNLDVTRMVAGALEAAGAEVSLTRSGELKTSDQERVRTSAAFESDRFLRIGHRARGAWLGYYPSSKAAQAWAQRAAATFSRLGLGEPRFGEDAQYTLQQVACPALFASPSRLDDSLSEWRLQQPGVRRAEAYALVVALAREFAPAGEWPLDSLTVQDADGQPVAGALVTFGGAIVLESNALGRVHFVRSEPGPLEVTVRDPRVNGRLVLLDLTRGVILTGPRGR